MVNESLSGQDPFEQEPDVIEVATGHWARGHGADVLSTVALDPCVGIAVWNESTRVGHMAHFEAGLTHISSIKMTEFLTSIQADNVDPTQLRGWLRGARLGHILSVKHRSEFGTDMGEAVEKADEQLILDARIETMEALEQVGLSAENGNLDVAWANPEDSTDMELNCADGSFRSAVVPEELFDETDFDG